MQPLKLAVFDADDLSIVSAHLQDALGKVGDIAFLPEERRFALVVRRFDWESGASTPRRRLTGLHFERVLAVRTRGIDRSRPEEHLNLLAIKFDETDPPAGTATLFFAGGGCIQLELECLEALMKDMGPIWAAGRRPMHDAETA